MKLSKWEAIEEKLNDFIKKSGEFFNSTVTKLTPGKVKSKLRQGSLKFKANKGNFKAKAIEYKSKAVEKIGTSKEKALVKVVATKEKANALAVKAKETDYRAVDYKALVLSFFAVFAPMLTKFKKWYFSLEPTTIVSGITLSSVAMLASITIYQETSKMSEKSRAPASELVEQVDNATAISRRPAYFKKQEKQFVVSNIALPIYLDSAKKKGMKKLIIDFSIESSNRYIKEYFWTKPYLLQDKLNTTIEPISIDFPLNVEGKQIIKDKIKRETNNLLKDLKIKGEVKDVRIHRLLGG